MNELAVIKASHLDFSPKPRIIYLPLTHLTQSLWFTLYGLLLKYIYSFCSQITGVYVLVLPYTSCVT